MLVLINFQRLNGRAISLKCNFYMTHIFETPRTSFGSMKMEYEVAPNKRMKEPKTQNGSSKNIRVSLH